MIPQGLHLFPEPADVFAEDVDQHAAVLFPIFSIDLATVDPTWSGRIHMLLHNCDPYNTATAVTFTTYCKDNSIGFDVIDGKYRFQTDFAYFDVQQDWKRWFDETKRLFEECRDRFRSTGGFPMEDEPFPVVDQFGGETEWVQNDETPLDPDGEPMRFIAKVTSLTTRTTCVAVCCSYSTATPIKWR